MKIKITILIFLVFLLTGCWDYIGLNEITIVTGIAIDKNEKSDKYDLTFEYASLIDSAKKKSIQTKIIESSGKTIFEAVRNAKKRVMNKLYFANAQTLIVSEDVAKEGISNIIDWFLRDAELRETTNIAISKEDKAKDIMISNSVDNPSTSYEIQDIIEKDRDVTGSIKRTAVYEAYDILKNSSETLALPVFHLTKNDDKKVVEAYGIGLFKNDKLIGMINATDSKMFLFIDNSINGGIIPLKQDGDTPHDISLEIARNSTKTSYKYKKNKLEITIETDTTVYIGEYENQTQELTDKDVNKIAKQAEVKIEKDVKKLIEEIQGKYKSDVFSFSSLVYRNDPKLWKKIKKDWNKLFLKSDIKVKSKVEIINSSFLK
jgi:spore germination protein KC